MQDQRKNINENYKEEQNKQKETNFSSLKPKEEQNPQTTLTAKEIKKRILRSLDTGELDEKAIEALKTLNHQNRANLTEEEKNQLDKELVDRELHTYGSKRYILEKVIDLLAKGADVNAQDDSEEAINNSWTALHYAAFHDNTDLAEFLLKYGANIFIIDYFWETPLTLAIKGYKEYENASEKENIEKRRKYLEVSNLLLTKLFQMGFNIDKPLDEIDDSTKNIAITLKKECNEKIASSIKQRIEQ